MLTNQDLNAIGDLIDTRLESKLEEKLSPIRNNIQSIKKDVKKLRSGLKTTVNFFDKEDSTLLKKLNKTRSEIGLSELNFA
jgi:hypothetical protein